MANGEFAHDAYARLKENGITRVMVKEEARRRFSREHKFVRNWSKTIEGVLCDWNEKLYPWKSRPAKVEPTPVDAKMAERLKKAESL